MVASRLGKVVAKAVIGKVSKTATLILTVSDVGTGSGQMKLTIAFDRKDYGMNRTAFDSDLIQLPFLTCELTGEPSCCQSEHQSRHTCHQQFHSHKCPDRPDRT